LEPARKRALGSFVLVILALPFSMLAVTRVDHRLLPGSNGSSGSFEQVLVQLVQGSGGGGPGNGGNYLLAGQGQTSATESVELLVIVLEDVSGSLRRVESAIVNVTKLTTNPSEIERGRGDIVSTGGEVVVASQQTNRAGRAAFELPPNNYTVYAYRFGVLGNFSLTLTTRNPQVTLLWTFRESFETPALVQLNDEDGDGTISPGETMALFYEGNFTEKPQQITLAINEDTSVNLSIVSATIFPNGIYFIVTPLEPIVFTGLSSNSTLLVGTAWWEASLTQ
jgi:hypothetical protein